MKEKRYSVTIQHEVIVYADNEEHAKLRVKTSHPYIMHHNLQCVSVFLLQPIEDEKQKPIFDERKAPGT